MQILNMAASDAVKLLLVLMLATLISLQKIQSVCKPNSIWLSQFAVHMKLFCIFEGGAILELYFRSRFSDKSRYRHIMCWFANFYANSTVP